MELGLARCRLEGLGTAGTGEDAGQVKDFTGLALLLILFSKTYYIVTLGFFVVSLVCSRLRQCDGFWMGGQKWDW